MYTAHYGLREKPFSLTPDPRYLFLSASHREALAHVLYGIEQGEGFISVTGEVGTGKTTLCWTLLERLGLLAVRVVQGFGHQRLGGQRIGHECVVGKRLTRGRAACGGCRLLEVPIAVAFYDFGLERVLGLVGSSGLARLGARAVRSTRSCSLGRGASAAILLSFG